ncbi:MAG: hypothetical protein E7408_05465 [Ruminococcaceae bacterium]|nr:hypothetical protein [Oscillospiraceae bacterium]
MKKIAGILAALMILTMLGGCYKSDTMFRFTSNGGVEVTSTFLATEETFVSTQVTPEMIVEDFSEEDLASYMETNNITETGKRLELSIVDENGNVIKESGIPKPTPVPEIMPDAEGTEDEASTETIGETNADTAEETSSANKEDMTGTRLRMRFDSLDAVSKSFLLGKYMQSFGTVSLAKDESGFGLDMQQKQTLLGTKYIVSGKISLYGVYNGYGLEENEEFQEKLTNASNSVTFKFPFLTLVESRGTDEKSMLGQTMTWTATKDAPEREVNFEVTVINPLIFGMAVVIVLLVLAIILILLRAKKSKKDEPDSYYMD